MLVIMVDKYGSDGVLHLCLDQAAEIANLKAPEHLELAMEEGSARDKVQKTVHNYEFIIYKK